ncbi:hypothetical protein [Streptomyces sp. NPDC048669]|uniref:hypothetical protein n=1 Tax=Streptomyces sp. NPDC048669 TaxID=3155267 RepID=UPI003417B75A
MQLVRPLHETDGSPQPAANSGWPNEARLGVVVLMHLDHVPALPGPNPGLPPVSVARRGPYPQIMDVHTTSQHEYGLRVGAFRILDLLDDLEIPTSTAIDAYSARHRPRLVERLAESDAEFVAHGVDGISILHDGMERARQRAYLAESVTAIEESCGVRPSGWSGLDYAQSTTTLEDLAELGIRWTSDWPDDETPNVLPTAHGDVLNIPVSIHLDDVFSHLKRGIPIEKWAENIVTSARVLLDEEAPRDRTLVLGLHPWLIAQPFRFAHLREVMRTLREMEGLWWARGSDVVAHLDNERTRG